MSFITMPDMSDSISKYKTNHTFNSIIASPRIIGEGYCSGFSEYKCPSEFVDFILSGSATMIYLPYVEADRFAPEIDDLSRIAKNHVFIVDKKKTIFKETKEIISSISSELDYSEQQGRYIDSALDSLLQFLYHIRLAKEYESEADVSRIYDLQGDLKFILDKTRNKEARTLVSEIMGFFNCYRAQSIESNILRSNLGPRELHEKFELIMQDSRYLALSDTRHQLNRDLNLVPKINILARNIALSKEYKKIIRIFKLLTYTFVHARYISKIDLINTLLSGHYIPTLIDLDDIALKAIYKEITQKEWDDKRMAEECEEFYVCPWSVYDLPGEPMFKDK